MYWLISTIYSQFFILSYRRKNALKKKTEEPQQKKACGGVGGQQRERLIFLNSISEWYNHIPFKNGVLRVGILVADNRV